MIDLRYALPTGIEVGGAFYELDTDFRVWLEFGRGIEEDGTATYAVFRGERPEGSEWVQAALEFYQSENATPHGGGGDERAYDLIRDGDYIVGSFWQAYGIDLTTAKLHWHVFLALFRSLPGDCKMAEVMGYRTFKASDLKRKPEQRYAELRKAWALPPKQDRRMIDWQEQAFGNIEWPGLGDAAEG